MDGVHYDGDLLDDIYKFVEADIQYPCGRLRYCPGAAICKHPMNYSTPALCIHPSWNLGVDLLRPKPFDCPLSTSDTNASVSGLPSINVTVPFDPVLAELLDKIVGLTEELILRSGN